MKPNLKRPILMQAASALLTCALLTAGLPNAQPASAAPPIQKTVPAPQAPEATPIVGGTSYGGATQLSPDVEYSSTVSTGTTDDFFYIDVSPGQIATFSFTSTVNWSGFTRFYLFDEAHVSNLVSRDISTQEVSQQIIYISNSTTPSRYYFRAEGSGATKEYFLQVTLENQNDGIASGDAGDTSPTARIITPTLNTVTTFTGKTGGKDAEDWYRISVAAGQRISVTVRVLNYGADNFGSVYFRDAATPATQIDRIDFASPSTEPQTFEYMSNNTEPTAYLVQAAMGTTSSGAPLGYQIDVVITNQSDGGLLGDAGDTAPTARVITPTLGVLATYTGTSGQSDGDDWFRVNAVSGMRISVTVTIVDFGNDNFASVYLRDAAFAANQIERLDFSVINVPQASAHMANNTGPTAYLIHMGMGRTGPGKSATYRITVLTEQQTDGTTPGDAGDDFDSALVITPTLNANSNILGSADDNDYYKIDLPIDTFTGAGVGVPYKIFVAPVPWPAGSSGSLRITKYAANRSQIGQEISIVAPLSDGTTIDLTNCDGCYVKVTDESSGTPQLKYIFTLLKPFTVYAPFIRKP